ncbi:MAG: glycosyltransferase family 4 protein [Acidimicrobiia bacterium]
MRIALVNNFFLPRASGSAHLTDGLARTMAARGHSVLVVTAAYDDAAADETRHGYRVVRLPSWSLPKTKLAMNYDVSFTVSPRNYRRFSRLLDEFAPDVVHQHGQFFDLTWMSAVWARRRRVPTVLTVHTALVHTAPAFAAVLWVADMLLPRTFLAIGRPHVVTIDWFLDSYVRRRYRLSEDRIVPVPIGVDPERFDNVDGSLVRGQLGLGGRPVVLSIGHVIPLRDRLALVRAMPYLLEKRPDAVVLVVGNVYDDRFLHLADELGVRDSLVVTGGVAREEVPSYVAAADVEGHDFQGYGLGNASLEVMAAQVPVVSVVRPDNFPGVELRSWENIVIVPPEDPGALADAVVRLLDDPELARRVGAGQRKLVVDNFAIDAVTTRHLELYERIAGRGALVSPDHTR